MIITYDESQQMLYVDYEREMNGLHGQAIHLAALVTWSELLGYTNLVDTLGAIIEAAIEQREPEPCPVTGENAWTATYAALTLRENIREREALRALEEGKAEDPRSPALRAALAVRDQLPRNAEGRAITDVIRVDTCNTLCLAVPTLKRSAVRGGSVRCSPDREASRPCILSDEERAHAAVLLSGLVPELERIDHAFCHSLTDNAEDPLKPVETVEAPTLSELSDSILSRYGVDRSTVLPDEEAHAIERQDHAA